MIGVLEMLGKVAMLLGYLAAVGSNWVAFACILKSDIDQGSVKALKVLLIPGYLLYYVWRSEFRMPRVLRVWVGGGVLLIVGVFVLSMSTEL